MDDERILYCAGDDRAESEGALLFHHPDRGTNEYFLVEARCQAGYDDGTRMSGVATWQVAQQEMVGGGGAAFVTTRDYPASPVRPGCTAIDGGQRCTTPSVCLHDTRADNSDVCYGERFLVQRDELLQLPPQSLQWADRTWAGVDLRVTPVIEFIDYGIPGYRHVETVVGYRVAWSPRS